MRHEPKERKIGIVGDWRALVVATLLLGFAGAEDLGRRTIRVPDCVIVRSEARPRGYQFNHVVYVRNSCPLSIDCLISTTVDPEPEHPLVVLPGRENGVITRTGASRRNFKPQVSCKLRAKASAGQGPSVVSRAGSSVAEPWYSRR